MDPDAPIPVVQYLRMSTEQQQYPVENQAAAIQAYAAEQVSRSSKSIPTPREQEHPDDSRASNPRCAVPADVN